jgi:hypothetical protein
LHRILFLIVIVGGGAQLGPLDTAAPNKAYLPVLCDYDDGEIGGMIGRGNRSTRRKCPSAALSTTNPTCCPDANPGHRGGKPGTNRLSYGTAYSAHNEVMLYTSAFCCAVNVRLRGTLLRLCATSFIVPLLDSISVHVSA